MQASSGVRLSNMFNAPNFEEVEGYIGLDCQWVSLSVHLWVTLALVREPLEIESWNFTCNKRTIFFFFVAFGVAELHPFIKSFVLIFPL